MNMILENYLQKLESDDMIYLTEFELRSLFNGEFAEEKMNAIKDKIKKAINLKKPLATVQKLMSIIPPNMDPKEIERKISKYFHNFSSLKMKSHKVLKNSLPENISDTLIDAAATVVTLKSCFRKKDEPDNVNVLLNKNLKHMVHSVNSFLDAPPKQTSEGDYEFEVGGEKVAVPKEKSETYLPDIIMGIVICVTGATVVAGIIYGVLFLIEAAAASPWLLFFGKVFFAFIIAAIIVSFIGWVLSFIKKMWKGTEQKRSDDY